ncbi:hypothetical protein DFJ73DRAFT_964089 [Zopfochytrium polystomum]|nr:hypothetical protein DFJ73DRAFT_964089 [Zopfochytrium polystomum]
MMRSMARKIGARVVRTAVATPSSKLQGAIALNKIAQSHTQQVIQASHAQLGDWLLCGEGAQPPPAVVAEPDFEIQAAGGRPLMLASQDPGEEGSQGAPLPPQAGRLSINGKAVSPETASQAWRGSATILQSEQDTLSPRMPVNLVQRLQRRAYSVKQRKLEGLVFQRGGWGPIALISMAKGDGEKKAVIGCEDPIKAQSSQQTLASQETKRRQWRSKEKHRRKKGIYVRRENKSDNSSTMAIKTRREEAAAADQRESRVRLEEITKRLKKPQPVPNRRDVCCVRSSKVMERKPKPVERCRNEEPPPPFRAATGTPCARPRGRAWSSPGGGEKDGGRPQRDRWKWRGGSRNGGRGRFRGGCLITGCRFLWRGAAINNLRSRSFKGGKEPFDEIVLVCDDCLHVAQERIDCPSYVNKKLVKRLGDRILCAWENAEEWIKNASFWLENGLLEICCSTPVEVGAAGIGGSRGGAGGWGSLNSPPRAPDRHRIGCFAMHAFLGVRSRWPTEGY